MYPAAMARLAAVQGDLAYPICSGLDAAGGFAATGAKTGSPWPRRRFTCRRGPCMR